MLVAADKRKSRNKCFSFISFYFVANEAHSLLV